MKNLKNNLTLSSSEFLRLIISSKRNTSTDCNRKTRLLSLETKIAPPYSDYDTRFTTNDLISLINLNVSDVEKSDLLSLYSYKNTKLTNFRKKISTDTSNIYQATCQYCTINSVNSLDHFVPKNSFPEFSVHPNNLIPSCTECNSLKSERWIINNRHLFLNLYKDLLPNSQYLFVDLKISSLNNINVNFKLKNINNIDPLIYEIITTHYQELELLRRFKENSSNTIIELTNSIHIALNNGSSLQQIKQNTLQTCQLNKNHKGFNHYQIILEETLIQSNSFLSLF